MVWRITVVVWRIMVVVWRIKDVVWRIRDVVWRIKDVVWRIRDVVWRMRDVVWRMRDVVWALWDAFGTTRVWVRKESKRHTERKKPYSEVNRTSSHIDLRISTYVGIRMYPTIRRG